MSKDTKLKEDYLKYTKTHGIKHDTWTYAQYKASSPAQRRLARAGVNYSKVKRMK
jgi:hypothetical protein